MEIGTAEISRIIKEQIRDYEKTVEIQEVGTVLSTGDGIARIYGLDRVAAGELLEFPPRIYGVAPDPEKKNTAPPPSFLPPHRLLIVPDLLFNHPADLRSTYLHSPLLTLPGGASKDRCIVRGLSRVLQSFVYWEA